MSAEISMLSGAAFRLTPPMAGLLVTTYLGLLCRVISLLVALQRLCYTRGGLLIT